jgi:hypothetical protein
MTVEIKIQLEESGQVLVTAPFENQLMCLGLMEIAKGVIIEQGKKPKSNIIIPEFKING